MEMSIFIFFLALLIPGIWLVLVIGREFKRREGFSDQQRIEQEHAAYLAARRRVPLRSAAHTAQTPASPVAASMAKEATAKSSSSAQEGGSRQDATPLGNGTAFENLLGATSQQPASDQFKSSQLEEAFEKFLTETGHEMSRAAR
ncbi:MAG: hypothetical protein WCF57_01390 [Pyrinomonadaceae bacterium]